MKRVREGEDREEEMDFVAWATLSHGGKRKMIIQMDFWKRDL
jgi:hypothetical protein